MLVKLKLVKFAASVELNGENVESKSVQFNLHALSVSFAYF